MLYDTNISNYLLCTQITIQKPVQETTLTTTPLTTSINLVITNPPYRLKYYDTFQVTVIFIYKHTY